MSDSTNPSNPLNFITSETDMMKSLLEDDILSGIIPFTNNKTFVEGFFNFRRATDTKVPKKERNTTTFK